MRLERRLFEQLDRPGGRTALAAALSRRRSAQFGRSVRVRHTAGRWVVRIDGVVLDVDDHGWSDPREWERVADHVFFWQYQPRPGDVIVDIGAGIGTEVFSYASRLNDAGTIHLVEAHPTTFARLERLVDLNLGSAIQTTTTLDRYAISDHRGVVQMSDDDTDRANHLGGTGVEADAITLDDFVERRGIDRIDFLKMNIEGAEREALRAADHALAITRHGAIGCHDFRYAEEGNDYFRTKDDVRRMLLVAGFEIDERPDAPEPWTKDYLYISRP